MPRIDYFGIVFHDYIVVEPIFGYLYFPRLSKSNFQVSTGYVKKKKIFFYFKDLYVPLVSNTVYSPRFVVSIV